MHTGIALRAQLLTPATAAAAAGEAGGCTPQEPVAPASIRHHARTPFLAHRWVDIKMGYSLLEKWFDVVSHLPPLAALLAWQGPPAARKQALHASCHTFHPLLPHSHLPCLCSPSCPT